jgi:hypothetical protein
MENGSIWANKQPKTAPAIFPPYRNPNQETPAGVVFIQRAMDGSVAPIRKVGMSKQRAQTAPRINIPQKPELPAEAV